MKIGAFLKYILYQRQHLYIIFLEADHYAYKCLPDMADWKVTAI